MLNPYSRFRLVDSPLGAGKYGIFDTDLQQWASATPERPDISVDMTIEEAQLACEQMNIENDTPPFEADDDLS